MSVPGDNPVRCDTPPPSRHSDLLDVASFYDTPKSTRPSSAVEPGHYDSPRGSSLYDVPKSSQLSLSAAGWYDTPPPSRAVSAEQGRNKEDTSDNDSAKSTISQTSSALHYSVKNTDGRKDIYSKPSLRLKPPELPPRNTPTPSIIGTDSGGGTTSPDYMDVEDEDIEQLETFQPNAMPRRCKFCREVLENNSKMINSNGDLYHTKCFVCAQCFQPFEDGVYFEFEKRKYCKHDFQVLFASCCAKCSEFIVGRVIKALSATWHPQCLTCHRCDKPVSDLGFTKLGGRAVCRDCAAAARAELEAESGAGGAVCRQCGGGVAEGAGLRHRGHTFHPHHFQCAGCGAELTSAAREVRARPGLAANKLNELYCLRCHDKMNIPICGACRRPIEERVVTAMGKHWHVEHFACAKCEKPFLGHRHYEKNGLAYCMYHYHQLFGTLCHHCNGVIQGDVFTALGKAWCPHHLSCSACDRLLGHKTKFFEVDLRPVCGKCYDKLPRQVRLRLKQYHELETRRERGARAGQLK